MSRLFVYGTLREEGATPAVLRNFRKRTDGPYPTIEPARGETVEGQVIEVDDWAEKDRYEGHRRGDPGGSLYWRLGVGDGYTQVYVGNPVRAERTWGRSWDVDYDRESIGDALIGADLEVLG